MFENMLRNPATTLKNRVIYHFKTVATIWICIGVLLGISMFTIAVVADEFLIALAGIIIAVLIPVLACSNLYIKTLERLANLEMIEDVRLLEEHFVGARAKDRKNAERAQAKEKAPKYKVNLNETTSQDGFVDAVCPSCGECLSVPQGGSEINCPYCDTLVRFTAKK